MIATNLIGLLIKFDELGPVLDTKRCWMVDFREYETNECFFAIVGDDFEKFEKSIFMDTIPLVSIQFRSFWMNQFIPRLGDEVTLESLDLLFLGLRMAQNLRMYSRLNWEKTNSLKVVKRRRVFVAIMSRDSSYARRHVIRATWLSCLLAGDDIEVTYKFFVGGTFNNYGEDTIWLPIAEGYSNLGKKMDLVFEWVRTNAAENDYFVRFDDDVYVRADLLVDRIRHFPHPTVWWGSFTHTAVPVRDPTVTKEYISVSDWPVDDSYYPLFARGFAYVISMSLVLKMDLTDPIPFDDVQLGIRILALVAAREEVVILDEDEENIAMHATCASNDWSTIRPSTLVVHHVDTEQIACMHAQEDICLCTQ